MENDSGLIDRIKRWYSGTTTLHIFDNDPKGSVFMWPLLQRKYHWTAIVARAVVGFYLRHWLAVWTISIGLAGLILKFFP